jgi:hypothetical protein
MYLFESGKRKITIDVWNKGKGKLPDKHLHQNTSQLPVTQCAHTLLEKRLIQLYPEEKHFWFHVEPFLERV